MRVGPPLVLGCALAYVDIHCAAATAASDTSNSKPCYAALAVTAEGEVWRWSIDALTAKFRCAVRTNIRPVLLSMKCQTGAGGRDEKGGDRRKESSLSGADIGSTGKDKSRASNAALSGEVEPGQDARRNRAAAVRIKVQACALTDEGDIHVHVQASSGGASAVEGGEWQAFSYDADAQAWSRLADMRHVLSRYLFLIHDTFYAVAASYRSLLLPLFSLFAVKTMVAACAVSPIINADINDANAPSGAAGAPTLSALQSMAATGANFGTKDIVGIAAAKQAALHAAMSSLAASGAAPGGSLQEIHRSAAEGSTGGNGGAGGGGGGDKKIAPTAEEWVCLATISHVEVSRRACGMWYVVCVM
jgi:hypothetical protein